MAPVYIQRNTDPDGRIFLDLWHASAAPHYCRGLQRLQRFAGAVFCDLQKRELLRIVGVEKRARANGYDASFLRYTLHTNGA